MPNKCIAGVFGLLIAANLLAAEGERLNQQQAVTILERRCLNCHNRTDREGGLSLETRADMLAGGDGGAAVTPGDADTGLLLEFISGDSPEMPQDAKPLEANEVTAIRKWIDAGAALPKDLRLTARPYVDLDWWSLKPVKRPRLPPLTDEGLTRVRTPIDHFIIAKLEDNGLQMSPEADRRTLIRRLYFDLLGLPPTPEVVSSFVADPDPLAYEKLVDRLLDSPRYGERWARHWLDVVHYADTHGYDKDKLRENAWPYRDYVIRAFNNDKPYWRFVQEQVAGDVLWPDTTDGVVATGFLAAGPWDFIGHSEVPESKIDGQVARHLDRDDMVRTVFQTFNSTTVGCARCHNHKFDPVSMEDYYSLHAVFAAIDRADREYEVSEAVARQRRELLARQSTLQQQNEQIQEKIRKLAGPELAELDRRIVELNKAKDAEKKERPEFGYHSQIESRPDIVKWVQVDLGKPTELARVVIVGCHDNFNNIGAGFGFPVRFRIEAGNDPNFTSDVHVVADQTTVDFPNPGVTPQVFPVGRVSNPSGRVPEKATRQAGSRPHVKARYIRVTATKLANRLPTDHIFALAELLAFSRDGQNVTLNAKVKSLDSIEAPVRWRRSNLVDGYYYGVWQNLDVDQLARLTSERQQILNRVVTADISNRKLKSESELAKVNQALKQLPPKGKVYAGCVHHGKGNFRGRGGLGPREIYVLHRGQVTRPGKAARPGTIPIIPNVNPRFDLSPEHSESDRRVALARWLTRDDNPLTWRSIVNRVWQYHFGRGIVDSPNDFGRMGQKPSHPELLDWLAAEFRDNGQSIKQMHRTILCSATYRQTSTTKRTGAFSAKHPPGRSGKRAPSPLSRGAASRIDASNRLLWRMNRRKLEAEAIRDSILLVAGRLDTKMYGPGFRDFVLERPQHSPHYEYHKHDPNDPATHRRSIYRFIVRSQPQPLMDTLDCADPSLIVGKRNETITALQALALLNSRFVVAMSEQFAERLKQARSQPREQISSAVEIALGRKATENELDALTTYAQQHGSANACRLILNLNEFSFVD